MDSPNFDDDAAEQGTTATVGSDPFADDHSSENSFSLRDAEWERIKEEFNTAGYREGITAGKESASQEGFDRGYEEGAKVGRRVGLIRGAIEGLRAVIEGNVLGNGIDGSLLVQIKDLAHEAGVIEWRGSGQSEAASHDLFAKLDDLQARIQSVHDRVFL